jgi:hypothetical protein
MAPHLPLFLLISTVNSIWVRELKYSAYRPLTTLVLSGETYTKSFKTFYKDAISNWLPSYMYTLAKYILPELVVRQQLIGRYWVRRLEVQKEHENAMASIDNEFAALKASRMERRNARDAAKAKQEADGTRLST